MNIRTRFRSIALFLALTMLLPLLGISAGAVEAQSTVPTSQTEPTVYYSESFDGKQIKDVNSSAASSAVIVEAQKNADDRGDVWQYTLDGDAKYDYYTTTYDQKTVHGIVDYVINPDGTLTGTKENGAKVTNAKISREDVDRNGLEWTYDSNNLSCSVVTGKWQNIYGQNWDNLGANTYFKVPAISSTGTVTYSMKMYLSPDAKFPSDKLLQVRLCASKWFFLSNIRDNGSFVYFDTNDGEFDATATSNDGRIQIPKGQWFDVFWEVDMATSSRTLYVDGRFVGTYTSTRSTASQGMDRANALLIGLERKEAASSEYGGMMQIDDLLVYEGTFNDHPDYKTTYYENDFEIYEGVSNADFVAKGLELYRVKDIAPSMTPYTENGNTSLRTDLIKTFNGSSNHNVMHLLSIPPLSYKTHKRVYFEAKYFFPEGSKGTIESQLYYNVQNGTDDNYINLWRINTATGWVEYSNNHYMNVGEWNTIGVLADLEDGVFYMYINGKYANTVRSGNSCNGPALDIQWGASKPDASGGWAVAKIQTNTVTDEQSGYFLVDDCRVIVPSDVMAEYDFENYANAIGASVGTSHEVLASPSLATYAAMDGNTAIRLDLAPQKSADSYALVSTKLNVNYDLEWDPANPTEGKVGETAYTFTLDTKNNKYYTEIDGVKHYVMTDAAAEMANSGANIGVAFKANLPAISYKYGRAILEADFFIEEGSFGIFESQLEKYYHSGGTTERESWFNLFEINAGNGRLSSTLGDLSDAPDLYLNVGEWNNVKLLLDFDNERLYCYGNDVLAFSVAFPKSADLDDYTFCYDIYSAWSLAKAKRYGTSGVPNAEIYHGGMLVDNIRATVSSVADPTDTGSKFGNLFLSDEAFLNYASDALLEVIDGASIRLKDLTKTGIRFGSRVNEDALASLAAMIGAESITLGENRGTLITPEEYYKDTGALTHAALDQLVTDGRVPQAYLDVAFGGVYFRGDAGLNLEEGANYMVGSIVDLKDYTRRFASASYLEIVIGEETYVLYSDVVVRSAQQVATRALADESVEWTADQLEVLNAFAGVQN